MAAQYLVFLVVSPIVFIFADLFIGTRRPNRHLKNSRLWRQNKKRQVLFTRLSAFLAFVWALASLLDVNLWLT
jgi:hypothetical protein